jgi:dUTP pyrophosphatase
MTHQSVAGEMLDRFSGAMIQHIEFYTVGQYSDYPDDPAAKYSVNDCLWQIQKYVSRHGKNARPGQDRIDMLKVGHYAALSASKIAKINPGQKPRGEALSCRSWEWLTVLSMLKIEVERGKNNGFKLYDDYISHIDRLALILRDINRRTTGPAALEMLQVIYHAGLAWNRMPQELADGMPLVRVRRLHAHAKLPVRKTDGAAGADLSAIDLYEIPPGGVAIIRTGISVEIPEGHEGQVRARSGLSAGKQLILLNGVGTIDSDYRGEIMVPVQNISRETQIIHAGDRIAQLVLQPVARPRYDWTESLSKTVRDNGGFGSTGLN